MDKQEYVLALKSQLSKKLKEDYSVINADEFEYAMRKYGIRVKDWGKSINLALIDEPIQLYLSERAEVSKFEEMAANEAEAAQKCPEKENIAEWSQEWEQVKEWAKKGVIDTYIHLIPINSMFLWLESEGVLVMDREEKVALYRDSVDTLSKKKSSLRMEGLATQDDIKLIEILKSGYWVSGDSTDQAVITEARLRAIVQLAKSEALNIDL